ncbi:uncharacterized protein LOC122257583 [Penaeus japonicus]|uniref:uncharacterized protein LOC122257583 n=1 Tax=Penaeus japonicus TaxID=27405 RepID=UPI001C70EFE9|nr:uncharacterized protein LOC122257583 [Penaeus japonicus]
MMMTMTEKTNTNGQCQENSFGKEGRERKGKGKWWKRKKRKKRKEQRNEGRGRGAAEQRRRLSGSGSAAGGRAGAGAGAAARAVAVQQSERKHRRVRECRETDRLYLDAPPRVLLHLSPAETPPGPRTQKDIAVFLRVLSPRTRPRRTLCSTARHDAMPARCPKSRGIGHDDRAGQRRHR